MKLLLVDDHADFTAVVTAFFLTAHDVQIVATIAAARAALETWAFDVALVDYDLDDGKGDDVVRWIRASRAHRRLPIIAISARAEGNAALVAAGADRVCAKVDFAGIAVALAAVTARREA